MLQRSRVAGATARSYRSLGPVAASATPELRLSYSPGLDGLRALAVMAVLLDWHARSAGHPEYFSDGLHLTPRKRGSTPA
jgi:hypothetical protein